MVKRSLIFLAGAMLALATAKGAEPFFPTAFVAAFDGKRMTVEGFRGKARAYALDEGKRVDIPAHAQFSIERADRFGDGMIEIVELGSVTPLEGVSEKELEKRQSMGLGSDFSVSFVAKGNVEVTNVVVIYYSRSESTGRPQAQRQLFYTPQKKVKNGKTEQIKVPCPDLGEGEESVVLFFSGSDEIRTSESSRNGDILRALAMKQHLGIVSRYIAQNEGSDHRFALLRKYPAIPTVTDGSVEYPEKLEMMFTVAPNGVVKDIEPTGEWHESIVSDAKLALGDWQFLPQLAAGVPQSTRFRIPVSFDLGH